MGALVFLIAKGLKNTFFEILRKPGKLAMWLLVIAAIAGVASLSIFSSVAQEEQLSLFILSGALFVFVTLFLVMSLRNGLLGGDVIFEMNDVNLLFVSPINPRKILLYGVARMTKTAFFAGFFILFQANTFAIFGINYAGLLLAFTCFILAMIVMFIASLLIYSTTNGNPLRKRLVKIASVALFVPLTVFMIWQYAQTGDVIMSVQAAASSPFMTFIPISGWTAAGVTSFFNGDILWGFIYIGTLVISGASMVAYIQLSNPDYFEDVLVATQSAFERKRAIADGDFNAAAKSKKVVRVNQTGIGGKGASAVFAKHMRESFRESRLGFLNLRSIIFIICAIGFAMFIGDLITTMQILMWIQIILIGTGRGLKETYSHYIYLIPESSFKKIIWSNMEIMTRVLLEGMLIFGVGGALIGADPLQVPLCFGVYVLFSFMLLGVNYLLMRFTGVNVGRGVLIMIYYLAVLLVMVPGIVIAVIIGFATGGTIGFLFGLAVLCAWELVAGLICLSAAQGVLHNCDMATMKIQG